MKKSIRYLVAKAKVAKKYATVSSETEPQKEKSLYATWWLKPK